MDYQEHIDKVFYERLNEMQSKPNPNFSWPLGCYGSALSCLLFIGISPGGKPDENREYAERNYYSNPYWNKAFSEPYDKRDPSFWGWKYLFNIPFLISYILGHDLPEGSDKLYGFANFDWVPCGNEKHVPKERIIKGANDVWKVVIGTKPIVLAALTCKAYFETKIMLEKHGIAILKTPEQKTKIKIGDSGKRNHWYIHTHLIYDPDSGWNAILVRLPQHPAKMLNLGYAERCSRAVRKAIEGTYNKIEPLIIFEE